MKLSNKTAHLITFLAFLALFCGQYLVFGVFHAPDTVPYSTFSPLVNPLYPIVMWLFRTPFGEDLGYFLLGFCQNILLVCSMFSLIDYLKAKFKFGFPFYLLLLFIVSFSILAQKLFTEAGIISSNVLFSEALTIPLYFFFFRYALQTFSERDKKAFLYTCLFAAALILTRGQLYWVLVVLSVLCFTLNGDNRRKALVSAVLICAAIAGFVQGSHFIQCSFAPDDPDKSPASTYVLTTAVYCSKPDDVALFPEDSAEQKLLLIARNWMDDPAQQGAFSYESGGLTNRQQKFEATYDILRSVLLNNYRSLAKEGYDAALTTIMVKLILANPGAFLAHCIQNVLTGLIRTVAILHPVINIFAGLFFVYIFLCLLITRRIPQFRSEYEIAVLGLLCVFLNALIMAPGVFALSRYMFYNLPILYICALLFLRALVMAWQTWRKIRK